MTSINTRNTYAWAGSTGVSRNDRIALADAANPANQAARAMSFCSLVQKFKCEMAAGYTYDGSNPAPANFAAQLDARVPPQGGHLTEREILLARSLAESMRPDYRPTDYPSGYRVSIFYLQVQVMFSQFAPIAASAQATPDEGPAAALSGT